MRSYVFFAISAIGLFGGASWASGDSISEQLDSLNERLNAFEARETGLQKVLMTSYLATTVPCAQLAYGSWVEKDRTAGRFLLGVGNGYAADDDGGLEEVVLTISEMPSHSHDAVLPAGVKHGMSNVGHHPKAELGSTTAVGGGQAHENMPPFLVVHFCQLDVPPE